MRQPEWTEILAVIGLTVALGLVAPGPRPRPSVSATAAPAAVSDTWRATAQRSRLRCR